MIAPSVDLYTTFLSRTTPQLTVLKSPETALNNDQERPSKLIDNDIYDDDEVARSPAYQTSPSRSFTMSEDVAANRRERISNMRHEPGHQNSIKEDPDIPTNVTIVRHVYSEKPPRLEQGGDAPNNEEHIDGQARNHRESIEAFVSDCTTEVLQLCAPKHPYQGEQDSTEGEADKFTKSLWTLCDPIAFLLAPRDASVNGIEDEALTIHKGNTKKTPIANTQRTDRKKYSLRLEHNMLFVKCGDSYASPDTIAMIMQTHPTLARTSCCGGKYPLHAACLRTLASQNHYCFQDRRQNFRNTGDNNDVSIESGLVFTEEVLCDISDLMDILDFLLKAYPEAARLPDFSGDLPAHHLARQLWRLEQQWAEEMQLDLTKNDRVVERSYDTISPLFHDITTCAEAVLKPIGSIRALCRGAGSVGTLLPLHIGCMHGVSYDTLQALLEGYPEAAAVPCRKALLGINGAFPLELFEARRPSTWDSDRFPTKKQRDTEEMAFDRCSDLIFAYFPSILPYRKDAKRLRRIEGRIIREATSGGTLTHKSKMLWLFLCTFTNEKYKDDNYSENVKSILSCLDEESTKKLVAVTSRESGKRVIDVAAPVCAVMLREALRSKGMDKDIFYEMYVSSRRYTTVGSLCRAIFGVGVGFMPTNFIILPYKIKYKEDNSVSLASKDDLRTAMNFASVLSRILNADELFHTITNKTVSSSHAGNMLASAYSMDEAIERHLDALLMTYNMGQGYLYLLDEESGNPVVAPNRQIYPIELDMHSNSAQRLLPLMQMGIQLMRGKSGLSVLGQILRKGSYPDVADSWFDASSSVLAMLRESDNKDTITLQEELERCIGSRQWRGSHFTNSEAVLCWRDEILCLKEILQNRDPERTYSGLRQVFSEKGSFFWTKNSSSAAGLESETISASDEVVQATGLGMPMKAKSIPELKKAVSSESMPLTDDSVLEQSVTNGSDKYDSNVMFSLSGCINLSSSDTVVVDGRSSSSSSDDLSCDMSALGIAGDLSHRSVGHTELYDTAFKDYSGAMISRSEEFTRYQRESLHLPERSQTKPISGNEPSNEKSIARSSCVKEKNEAPKAIGVDSFDESSNLTSVNEIYTKHTIADNAATGYRAARSTKAVMTASHCNHFTDKVQIEKEFERAM